MAETHKPDFTSFNTRSLVQVLVAGAANDTNIDVKNPDNAEDIAIGTAAALWSNQDILLKVLEFKPAVLPVEHFEIVNGNTAVTNIPVANIATTSTIVSVVSQAGDTAATQKFNLLAGTTATTNIAVTNIATTDTIVKCLMETAGVLSDVTAECSITSAGNIQLASTNSTGNTLLLDWIDVSTKVEDAFVDLTAEASVTSAGNIQLSTTNTTGKKLWVNWKAAPTAASIVDRSATTAITSAGHVQCTAVTTGSQLLVSYIDVSAKSAPFVTA